MGEARSLQPAELRSRCDPSRFAFETTAELPEGSLGLGQERAVEAVRFGVGIRRDGYNLFALGPPGMGKHGLVRSFLEQKAASEGTPSDWCYVADFANPHRPRALSLPPGRGLPLRRDLERLVEELKVALPAAFERDDYRNRRRALEAQLSEKGERAFADLERRARERGIAVVRTPVGIALAPTREGEVMDPEEFQRLPEADQKRLREEIGALQQDLQQAVATLPQEARQHREALRELDRSVVEFAVGHLIEELRASWTDVPAVLDHLQALQRDVQEGYEAFLPAPRADDSGPAGPAGRRGHERRALRRYEVNVLVDRSGQQGAPIVYEDHPSHSNLIGRIEHQSELGSLVTDFTLIRPGALHQANGGYLVLDARRVLLQPYAWEELKRALRSRVLRVESLAQSLSLVATVSLEPEPIPLEVKVLLVGDRSLYYLLSEADPEFSELFKVAADFEEVIPRDPESEQQFAGFLSTIARRERLRPLDRTAVARVVEQASRLAGAADRLSIHLDSLSDLLREADHLAGSAGRECLTGADVSAAVAGQLRRLDRVRERSHEEIARGTLLIDTRGAQAGQVNGLTVLQLGRFAFGRPSRITARVRLGAGRVVDIEREVELGGPIHSKGVLILSAYLGARYSADQPLSLHASLVFEQSYGGVEGDSASCAELVALLSALADAPLSQSLAVTGSVDQFGRVQPIGGVNEKVEGFYDVCLAAGLSGEQGVVIPATNVRHLMLREDVVAAVAEGRFRVHAIETVDQCFELLAGGPAGERDAAGRFPEASLNARVEARLRDLTERSRRFAREAREAGKEPPAGAGS